MTGLFGRPLLHIFMLVGILFPLSTTGTISDPVKPKFNNVPYLEDTNFQDEIDQKILKIFFERKELQLTTNSSYADQITVNKIQDLPQKSQENIIKVINLENQYGEEAIVFGANETLDVFKYLVFNGGKIKESDVFGQSTLQIASKYNNINVIKYLIDHCHIDINFGDESYNRTALSWAAFYGNLDTVQYLVQNFSADVNLQDKNGLNALHIASYKGYINVVEWLVKYGIIKAFSKDFERNRPLHYAAYQGHLEIAEFLIKNGAKINVRNNKNITAIHRAAFNNKVYVLKYLVEKGGYVNIKNKWGYSALHYGAERGHLDIVKYLVDFNKTLINIHNNDLRTPLHVAIAPKMDYYEIQELLNENLQNHIKNEAVWQNPLVLGFTFMMAGLVGVPEGDIIIHDHFARVRKRSVKPRFVNIFNHEFLHNHTNYDTIEIQEHIHKNNLFGNILKVFFNKISEKVSKTRVKRTNIFKDLNVEAENIDESDFYSEFLIKKEKSQFEIIKYLIEKGCADINTKDKDGNSPLYLATYSENLIKYLITFGADINTQNKKGNGLLHNLANSEGPDTLNVTSFIVKFNDTNINIQNNDGETPLHIAAENGNINIIKILFVNTLIAIDIKDYFGNTALHAAAKNDKVEVVTYLIEKCANCTKFLNNDGKTALDVAKLNGATNVIEYFLNKKYVLY